VQQGCLFLRAWGSDQGNGGEVMNGQINAMYIKSQLGIMQISQTINDLYSEAEKFQNLQNSIVEWSTATFGDRQTSAIPVLHHLEKETAELIEALEKHGNYKEEFADCFMLLIESAKTCGIETDELIVLTHEKLKKNKKRKWGRADDKGVIEHIKGVK
jgi:NTP pyrophosphatase (non-canonical NTP hydrolase)